jgi:membrane-associated phospholipid phosphatase
LTVRSARLLAALLLPLAAPPARAAPDLTPRLDAPPAATVDGAVGEDRAGAESGGAGDARAPNPLHVNLKVSVPVTLLAGSLSASLAVPWFAPSKCQWCTTDPFDAEAREALKLDVRDARAARRASDLLVNGVIPAGVITALALSELGTSPGAGRRFTEDVVVVLEAVAISGDLNGIAKNAFARQRPAVGADAMAGSRNKSFYSGHTSTAFSLATAAATVSMLRGYPATPWVWAAGLTLASGVGFLRVAGDAHWATDVMVGAVAGGTVGFLVPWMFHRVAPGHHAVDVRPSAGGIALVW